MTGQSADPGTARAAVRAEIERCVGDWRKAPDLARIRQGFDALASRRAEMSGQPLTLAGVPCATHGATEAPRLLYFHGGGYQIGSPRSHGPLTARLAQLADAQVVGVDYRRAPEHRFPAAFEDGLAVYAALCDEAGRGVALAGDSAGAGLALAVALAAREQGLPMPPRIALISGWLDLSLSGESYTSKASLDFFSKPEQLAAMARSYLGRQGDPRDPRVSPLWGDLRGLPPILLHAGDHDITLSDSETFARKARAAGVSVTLEVWPEMFHHFQLFPELPEAGDSLAKIGVFLRGGTS